MNEIFITESEASNRYRYSKYWFQRSRWDGSGPAFLKLKGKVLYPLKETDEWFMNHGLKKSTSEYLKG